MWKAQQWKINHFLIPFCQFFPANIFHPFPDWWLDKRPEENAALSLDSQFGFGHKLREERVWEKHN